MTEDTSRWIWIPHWRADDEHDGFQHYKDRDPVWIKNYRSLLRDDHYLDLNLASRGLLHGLWLVTAAVGNGRIPYRAMAIRRHLGVRETFRLRQLDPLIQAGFIDVRASEGLAERYQAASPEVEKKRIEKKKSDGAALATPKAARAVAKNDLPAHMRPFNPINNPGGYTKSEGPPILVKSIDEATQNGHAPIVAALDGCSHSMIQIDDALWKCKLCGLEQVD